MAEYNPRTAHINGISTSTGWKLHFDPINNNPKTLEAIESHLRNTAKVQFKAGNHGEGKLYTSYPQSLEERDRVIAALHHRDTGISHLLAPANPVEGNMQFTDKITGRFTTGYNYVNPLTGEIDWSRSSNQPEESRHSIQRFRKTGEVNHYIKDSWNDPLPSGTDKPSFMESMRILHEEVVEDIESLRTNHPAVHELMVGKPGYNSPYPLHLPGVDSAPVRPTVGIPPATTAPAPAAPTTGIPKSVNYSKPGSITRKQSGLVDVGHINSPIYTPKVPDMNINHGWKIHGDLVADLTREEAFAKMGLEVTDIGAKVIDQKAFDAFNSRLSKVGIDPGKIPKKAVDFGDSFIITTKTEKIASPVATQVANGRPSIGFQKLKRQFSNPLDTLSMMEVFHENENGYKASQIYREGRSFTAYTQSIENRDKLISSLESRLGNRLEDVNPNILGGHQTEGATQLSQKITGRFTTEYTDIPGAGGTMDWASQNHAGLKGQDAIDNVMATNPEMRPYIHTGVIGDESAANLQKLTSDFPVFDEMLHGPKGYVSPYGTIEDSFSQQGYDYKTGAAVKSAPVTPQAVPVTPQGTPVPPPASTSPKPVAAISQRRLEALEEMAQNGTEHEAAAARLKLEQIRNGGGTTPPPPRGPTIGTPTNVTTGASAQGPRAGKPVQPTGAAAIDTTLMSDAEKATMSGVKGGDGISVVDPGLGAKIKSNPGLTAREAMGTIGKEIKTFTKAQGKVDRKIAGHELSSAVAAGFKESKNLRLLGLGALVGVGYGASRVMHRKNNSDLQR